MATDLGTPARCLPPRPNGTILTQQTFPPADRFGMSPQEVEALRQDGTV
jgi:hypothetical protein